MVKDRRRLRMRQRGQRGLFLNRKRFFCRDPCRSGSEKQNKILLVYKEMNISRNKSGAGLTLFCSLRFLLPKYAK